MHHPAAILSLSLLTLVTLGSLLPNLVSRQFWGVISAQEAWLASAAIATTGILLWAILWDASARYSVAALYGLGLVAVLRTLVILELGPDWLFWTLAMVAGAYAVLTSYLWSRRRQLIALAGKLGVPLTADPLAGLVWLIPANVALSAVVVTLVYWVELKFDGARLQLPGTVNLSLRISAAQAALAQVLALGLLAQGARRSLLQSLTLWFGVLGAVAFGWAWLEPLPGGNWLSRLTTASTAVAGMTVLYGLGLSKLLKRENEWTRAAQQVCPSLLVLAGVTLGLVLGTEVYLFVQDGVVPMPWPAIVVTAAAMIGLAVCGIAMAVLPGRDPLNLSERGRTAYVYGAEALGSC